MARIAPLLLSALCAALLARMAWHEPRFALPLLIALILVSLPSFFARRRTRKLLKSGNVERVIGHWQTSFDRVMYPETMAPLMIATAYAAYGWCEEARRALARAAHGPAWDAALEQRLFVEMLLDTYEGARDSAMAKADEILHLPIPSSGWFARARVVRLREGMAAMARAFSHRGQASDVKKLRRAGQASPLVHWAMRYASAVIAIDQGKNDEAAALLSNAPEWPKESAFRLFHDELQARVAA